MAYAAADSLSNKKKKKRLVYVVENITRLKNRARGHRFDKHIEN